LNFTPKEGAAPLPCPASGKDRLRALLEAALFAAPEPLRLSALVRALGRSAEYLEELLDEWAAELEREHRGLALRLVAGGYQLVTKPEHHAELQQLTFMVLLVADVDDLGLSGGILSSETGAIALPRA
jgi:hypothetical protein